MASSGTLQIANCDFNALLVLISVISLSLSGFVDSEHQHSDRGIHSVEYSVSRLKPQLNVACFQIGSFNEISTMFQNVWVHWGCDEPKVGLFLSRNENSSTIQYKRPWKALLFPIIYNACYFLSNGTQ